MKPEVSASLARFVNRHRIVAGAQLLPGNIYRVEVRSMVLPFMPSGARFGCNEPGPFPRALRGQRNTWFAAEGVPGDRE